MEQDKRPTLKTWIKRRLKIILRGIEKLIPHYSLIGDSYFFDAKKFSWATELEENWQSIRQELDFILQYVDNLPSLQDIVPDGITISKDNNWKTYFLYGYGIKDEDSCQRFPQTTRLIEQIPGLQTAYFSILLPGKHIPEHRGVYKGVVHCHLGLKIPEERDKCGIKVGNETHHWEIGKCLFFDDSFRHEAWNKSNEIRVILLLTIVRPLEFPFSILNKTILKLIAMTPFVQGSQTKQKQWNERLKEALVNNNIETFSR